MEELIFVLLIIFVAYVVYKSGNEKKEAPKAEEPKKDLETDNAVAEAKPAASVTAKKATPIKPKVIKKATPKVAEIKVATPKVAEIKVAEIKVATPKVAEIKVAAPKAVAAKKGLKNPLTGEVATSYANYRFTKRWIKDALVAEGLLDQVYKNADLTEAVEANIKAAITKLEALDNYKP